jgi:hypothetical protein
VKQGEILDLEEGNVCFMLPTFRIQDGETLSAIILDQRKEEPKRNFPCLNIIHTAGHCVALFWVGPGKK